MYGGHLGVALAAWARRRRVPLWLLLVAAQLPDWTDAGLCLTTGLRGPDALYSHGLLQVAAGAILLALVYAMATRDATGAAILAALVLSHYPLDYLTGRKPTWPGGPVIGLGLYRRPAIDFAVEAAVIATGWLGYRRALPRSARRDGTVPALLAVLLALQALAGIAFSLDIGGRVKC